MTTQNQFSFFNPVPDSGFGTSGNPFAGFTSNPFLDILEDERNIPFQASLRSQNLTPNQLEFFQNDRKNIFDRFDALLGQDILSGQSPNRRFTDFIGDFDFGQEFEQTPQSQRNISQAVKSSVTPIPTVPTPIASKDSRNIILGGQGILFAKTAPSQYPRKWIEARKPPSMMLTNPSSRIIGNRGVKAKRPMPMANASETKPTRVTRKIDDCGDMETSGQPLSLHLPASYRSIYINKNELK